MALRNRWRFTAYMLATLAICAGVLLLAVHLPSVQRSILRRLSSRAESAGHVRIEASDFRFNLFSGAAHARGLVVRSAANPDLPPFAVVDSVTVQFRARRLLSGLHAITSISVRRPSLRIVVAKDGRKNLPDLESTGRSDWSALPPFTVEEASFRFEDESRGLRIDLPRWRLESEPENGRSLARLAALTTGAVTLQGRSLPVNKLGFLGAVQSNGLRVNSLDFDLAGMKAHLRGDVSDFSAPRLALQSTLDLELSSFLRSLSVKNPPRGRIEGDIRWSGKIGSPTGEGTIEATGLGWLGLAGWNGLATVRCEPAGSRFELPSFRVQSPAGLLDGEGVIDVSPQGKKSYLRARVAHLDLASLTQALGFSPRIWSRASGSAGISWDRFGLDRTHVTAGLALTALGTKTPAHTVALSGNASIGWDGRGLTLSFDPISGPGFAVAGSVQYGRSGSLAGELAGDVQDVTRLTGALGVAWPDVFGGIQVPVDGSLRVSGTIGGRWRDPRILANIEKTDLGIGRVQGLRLAGSAEYVSRRLAAHDWVLAWQGQTARILGDIDFSPPDSPSLSLEGTLSDVSLKELLSGLGWNEPVTGAVHSEWLVRGSLARPLVQASLRVEDLAAWNERLGTLTASARLGVGQLTLDTLRLDKPQQEGAGIIEASGTFDWERDLMTLKATGRALRLESAVIPGNLPMRGELALDAESDGALTTPRWSARLNGKAISIANQDLGPVRLHLEAEGRRATLLAEAPAYPATIRGEVETVAPFDFRVELDGSGIDVGRFGIPLTGSERVEGSFSLKANAQGSLAQPEGISGAAVLSDLVLRLSGEEVRGRGPLEARWHDRTLRIEPANLSSGESVLNIQGLLPLDRRTGEGSILANGSVALPLISHLLPGALDIETRGTVTLRGAVRGSFEAIEPLLEITANDGEVRLPGLKEPLKKLSGDIQLDPKRIIVRRLDANLGEGSVRLTGRMPFRALSQESREEPLQARLVLEQLDPGLLETAPPSVHGKLTAFAEVEGARADLGTLAGQARITQLKLQAGEAVIEQTAETVLRLANGVLRLEAFDIKGPNTALTASGSAQLAGERRLDLNIAGTSDARFLGGMGDGFGVSGPVQLKLAVGGTLDDPSLRGTAELADARFFLVTPPIEGESLTAQAEFDGRRVTLTRLKGEVNGGDLSAEGGFALTRDGLADLKLRIAAKNVFLDYPLKLRTASDINGEIRSEGGVFLLEGDVRVLEGQHREPINLQSLQSGPAIPVKGSPLRDRIRFNIHIRTVSPLSIDNNLGRIDAFADLRLVGTANRPALLGRVELDEDGRVYFAERSFTIQRGSVNFTNENAIEPTLDLSAQSRISSYTVTIRASGGLRDLETSFTSDPPASQDQIMSLLFTGSVDNADKITTAEIGSRGALSLFGSAMIGSLSAAVRQTLGFTEFRIEPTLISPDSDPSARLTVGQNIHPNLRITYSTNLRDSNDTIWVAEYDWRRTFLARYIDQSKVSKRGEALHRFRFGGGPGTGDMRTSRRERLDLLESFEITGNTGIPKETVARELDLRPGAKFRFLDFQERLEKLRNRYEKEGYLEARIRRTREGGGGKIHLKLDIDAGKVISFKFEGFEIGGSTKRDMRKAWRSGIVEKQRLAAATAILRRDLYERRYCDATVEASIEWPDDRSKSVRFAIAPGLRYRLVDLQFKGLDPLLADEIGAKLRKARLDSAVVSDSESVRRALLAELRENGYLTAEVEPLRIGRSLGEGSFSAVFSVKPGPRYRVGSIHVEGNSGVTTPVLLKGLKIRPGDWFVASEHAELARSMEDLYRSKGYREATVELEETANALQGTVNLMFHVRENQRSVIASIRTDGYDQTNDTFLRRRIPLWQGDPADGDKLAKIRRQLLNPGVYDMADLTLEPSQAAAASAKTRPVDLIVRVREPKPFSFIYGATYDSEKGAGLTADFSVRNTLGAGRLLGYRILGDLHELDQRVYFSQPFLGRHDISSTVDLSREDRAIDNLQIVKENLSLQQVVEFRRRFTLSYGYRVSRSTSVLSGEGGFKERGSTAPLFSALSRDTRDDVFDATSGSYASQAFEFGPGWFGGSQPYYRYFGQYFRYFGLTRPARVPFADLRRPRFVFATGIRVGFLGSRGSGQTVLPPERFFGGGASTIRGFTQNSLGPLRLEDGQPLGGQAVLFLNNELRMPFYRFVDAAAFLDVGNVWERPSDFRFSDLRESAGFGFRLRNPFILIRFDYGWKLNRRIGESKGAFHFSIGQAF